MAKLLSAMLIGYFACQFLNGMFHQPERISGSTDSASADSLSTSTKTAVIDVGRVFSTSKQFARLREDLKPKIADSEEIARRMAAEIENIAKQWKLLDPTSDERKELEARGKKKHEEFEKFKKDKARQFLSEESKIYLKIYNMVMEEGSTYAQAHRIDLVIRHNSEPLEKSDPQKLLQEMGRQVVYENKLDITDEIIAAMAER